MAKNDVVLLDSILTRLAPRYGAELDDSELFELFVFDQLLKPFDPTYDELSIGWVDGGYDGGLDGFFVYIDGRPCTSLQHKEKPVRPPHIHIVLASAKRATTFEQQPLDSFHASLTELMDLTIDEAQLKYPYNTKVKRQRARFVSAYIALADRKPTLSVELCYCSRGDASIIPPTLKSRGDGLVSLVRSLFGNAQIEFRWLGATELLNSARNTPDRSLKLPYIESFISRENKNFIVLSRLDDYYRFVCDEQGGLRRYLFESNVRDYLGRGLVNRDIAATISHAPEVTSEEDFWWVNNGVTILSTSAAIAGKSLVIENVQIINGLQTTETLYDVFQATGTEEDDRAILVKVIVASEDEVRARIIKATNYQSTVDLSSIRGLDKIQRDIEQYFEDHNWYYDRRRNHFKNLGKPADRIVSVAYLASAVRAVALGDPAGSARQRAKSLRDESVYSKVFDTRWSLDVFLTCLELARAVEVGLKMRRTHLMTPPIKLVHFMAYVFVCLELRRTRYGAEEVTRMRKRLPSTEEVRKLLAQLKQISDGLGGSRTDFGVITTQQVAELALAARGGP